MQKEGSTKISPAERVLLHIANLHMCSVADITQAQLSSSHALSQALYELKRRGYITRTSSSSSARLCMTQKGYDKAFKIELKSAAQFNSKQWDGIWRIVQYSIPEENRTARDAVRNALKTIGFEQLGRGLWVHPSDCATYVRKLAQSYGLAQSDVIIIEATSISGEDSLRSHFNISSAVYT